MGVGTWVLMVAVTVAFWLLVALAVREVLVPSHGSRDRRRRRTPGEDPVEPALSGRSHDPLSVVQARLARGDIDVDDYARIRRALVESTPSLDADRTGDGAPAASSSSVSGPS